MAGYYKAKQQQAMPMKPEKLEEAMEHGKPDNEMKEKMAMPFNRARNLGAYHHPPKRRGSSR